MEKLECGLELNDIIINKSIERLISQVYKLLPMREEGKNWERTLNTLILELVGMQKLLKDKEEKLFQILCKLEGMLELQDEHQFARYRATIFDVIYLLGGLKRE